MHNLCVCKYVVNRWNGHLYKMAWNPDNRITFKAV